MTREPVTRQPVGTEPEPKQPTLRIVRTPVQPPPLTATQLAERRHAAQRGDWFDDLCPAHADERPSLSYAAHPSGTGIILHCRAGCTRENIKRAMARAVGCAPSAFDPPQIVATYDYCDREGRLRYQVVRYAPKRFRQRRPNGQAGWIWKLDGVTPVPYRLPELQGSDTVYIPEGEKDVDRLRALGLTATCNSGGAGKWRNSDSEALAAAGVRTVVVLPDRDDPGHEHAVHVAHSCTVKGITAKILPLPGLADKGDVSDWLDAGHNVVELQALAAAAPIVPRAQMTPAPNDEAPTLPLMSIRELYNQPKTALAWVVDRLLPVNGLSLLAGKPKAGKSTFSSNLAVAVAHGAPFLGRDTSRGLVWMLMLEGLDAGLTEQFQRMGVSEEEPNIQVARFAPRPVDLTLRKAIDSLRQRSESAPSLIIVDTLFKALGLPDSDDYAQMVLALEPFYDVARETGAHLLLVHHSRKGYVDSAAELDSVLGSTAISGSVDTILLLRRLREGVRMVSSQNRYGTALDALTLVFDPATDLLHPGGPPAEIERRFARTRIVEFLGSQLDDDGHPVPCVEEAVLKGAEVRTETGRHVLRAMLAEVDSPMLRLGHGRKGAPFRYVLKRFASIRRSSGDA